MEEYRIVAESVVHPGRRLLVNHLGEGFLQLGINAMPLPVSREDFDRLRRMEHYRPVAVLTPVPQMDPVVVATAL